MRDREIERLSLRLACGDPPPSIRGGYLFSVSPWSRAAISLYVEGYLNIKQGLPLVRGGVSGADGGVVCCMPLPYPSIMTAPKLKENHRRTGGFLYEY